MVVSVCGRFLNVALIYQTGGSNPYALGEIEQNSTFHSLVLSISPEKIKNLWFSAVSRGYINRPVT